MDEDVFLIFVPFAAVGIAFAVLLLRRWEDEFAWERFRLSTVVWTTLTAAITLGFINMSDSILLVVLWAAITVFFCWRIITSDFGNDPVRRLSWMLIVCLPVSGWILYHNRFPHLHALEVDAERAGLDPSEILPRF